MFQLCICVYVITSIHMAYIHDPVRPGIRFLLNVDFKVPIIVAT